METRTTCKVIENGKYTKMVTMPKAWCVAYGVKPGNDVGVDTGVDGRLLVFSDPVNGDSYCRKVIKNGAASAFVTLPAEWCTENNITVGDTVSVQTDGNTLLIEAINA